MGRVLCRLIEVSLITLEHAVEVGYQESTREPVPGNEVREGKSVQTLKNRNTWRTSTIELTIVVPDWVNRMDGILLLMGKTRIPYFTRALVFA
jgi:hypothetical protein